MSKKKLDVYNDLDTLISEIKNYYDTRGLLNIAIGNLIGQRSTIVYLKGRVRNLVAKEKAAATLRQLLKMK